MIQPKTRQHIALVYDDKQALHKSIASYLNEGLEQGQLCIFATVYYRDEGFIQEFSKLIHNYQENIDKGNLLILDLSPLYLSALLGDMQPFEDAQAMFVEKTKNRADKHVRFVGDGTGFMFDNMHFEQCTMVEKWWQQKPFDGSYVCPFSKHSIDKFKQSGQAVIATHDSIYEIGGKAQ